ncbi:MAG: hypothetical protein D6718_04970 [Acidobacteria bacterium]|nr:MAG: hypothetical protein D6718_04970 [Acidobacteriota bacterium]
MRAGPSGRASRRRRLLLVGLALALSGCSARAPDAVLLVTLDTVRADHLSCYDPASPSRTPEIDRLAGLGALAERAWTTVPLTTPAHASILTGLFPPAHGVRNNGVYRLPDSAVTLAERLRAAGFRTAAFVASYTTSREFGLAQGFDLFDDDLGHDAAGRPRPQRPGTEVVARAEAWLREQRGRRFFAWIHLFDAHSPYAPPPELASRHPGDPYSAEVELVDRLVGRLARSVGAGGRGSRTLLVVVADHGEGLGTHGEKEHGFLLYEETVRVPLILVAPGTIAAGTRLRAPASVVDIVPTVLALLGLPPGETPVQGRDLLAPAPSRPRWIYAEALQPFEEFGWSPLYAGRQGDVKIVDGPRPELYDLSRDPGERHDLAPEAPERTARLLASFRAAAARLAGSEGTPNAARAGSAGSPLLESLGYAGGGPAGPSPLPEPGGRSPRDALLDHERFLRAQELLKAGQFAAGRALLERLHQEEPDNPQFLLKLAVARDRAGDPAAAEAAYAELRRRHPDFLLACSFEADFLVRRGRAAEAVALWERVRRRHPGLAGAEVEMAKALLAADRPAEAAAILERYLASAPDDAAALALLGRARSALGDTQAAVAAWERALSIRPTYAPAAEPLFELLRRSGRADEARRLVERLAERAPDDPWLESLARRAR